MPYRDPEKQKAAMRKIVKRHRDRKKDRDKLLEKAIRLGRLDVARQIMDTKVADFDASNYVFGKKKRKKKETTK